MLFAKTCAFAVVLAVAPASIFAQGGKAPSAPGICPRPGAGSIAAEPAALRSRNGVLQAELIYRDFSASDGQSVYCYLSKDGGEAPTLSFCA